MSRPFNPRVRVRSDRLAAVALALAPLVYFWPALAGRIVLCPDDGLIFNVPLRVAAANIVRGGSLPLWNPYIFGGMPLLAAAQAGLLFPPNWFYLILSAPAATNLSVISTYIIAGLGAFLYARRAGATVAGAFVTGLVWQWCGFTVGQLAHINIAQTAAVLPWVLWALDGYGQGRGRKWGAALAAFVALQAFVGNQQTFAYSLVLASVYATAMALSDGRTRARYFGSLAFVAAGLGLAAVQILPTFELLRNSLRSEATYEFFTSFSMPRRSALTFFALLGRRDAALPRPYVGPPFYAEMVGYVACRSHARARPFCSATQHTFWAAVAAVGSARASRLRADRTYRFVKYAVLNLFRAPARHMMESTGLAVLAGRGVTA